MNDKNNAYFSRNEILSTGLIKELESRRFESYFVQTAEEASDKVLELIKAGSSVAWGGSETLRNLDIYKKLYDSPKNFKIYDRDKASNEEEKREMFLKAFNSDYYLMSSNAISADGQLVNIDGTGNRVAALAYGPKNVIVVAGLNKVEKTLEEAVYRARNIAAPSNAIKLNKRTPCSFTGLCSDCKSKDTVCANITITRISYIPKRIKIILVNEILGF